MDQKRYYTKVIYLIDRSYRKSLSIYHVS